MKSQDLLAILTLIVLASVPMNGAATAQRMPIRPDAAVMPAINLQLRQDPAAKQESSDAPDTPSVVETTSNSPAANPREIRLHLWDGNVINGELDVEDVSVTTEFGPLRVPVAKIVSFRPGLDSFPKLRQQIDQWVDSLGSPDFKTREAARRQLISMGRLLHREIYRFQDGDNAERKRQLEEIRKEFEQQMDELEDEEFIDSDDNTPLIQGDSIETRDFVIVGKIDQSEFNVSSKYGALTVNLADIRYADRDQGGNVVRRTVVSVTGKNYAQSDLKSTGIRVNRGDRISIRASGSITMSPWGNQAVVNPDGNPQYGNFEGYGGGTLLARIGDSGDYVKVGSKSNFTATKAGLLQLGIAIQAEYANQSYQYPGEFKCKVIVEGEPEN